VRPKSTAVAVRSDEVAFRKRSFAEIGGSSAGPVAPNQRGSRSHILQDEGEEKETRLGKMAMLGSAKTQPHPNPGNKQEAVASRVVSS